MTSDPTRIDGRAVHAAWRDGMLAQGRTVAPGRMAWETLTDEDRALDDGIAAALSTTPAPSLLADVALLLGRIDYVNGADGGDIVRRIRATLEGGTP